jgi:HSP20 family protein
MATVTAVQRAEEAGIPKIVKFDELVSRVNSTFDAIARRAYGLFEENGRQFGHDLEDWFRAEGELLQPVKLDMTETDQGIEVKAEVPGFSEKELEISAEPNRLTIAGKHEASKEEKKGRAAYSETEAFEIFRMIALPAEVDAAKATATVKKGVLTVTLPKAAKEQAAGVKPATA